MALIDRNIARCANHRDLIRYMTLHTIPGLTLPQDAQIAIPPPRKPRRVAVHRPFPADEGSMPYIFVRCSHDDAQDEYPQPQWQGSEGFNVWYDEGIDPGSSWRDAPYFEAVFHSQLAHRLEELGLETVRGRHGWELAGVDCDPIWR